MSIPLTNRWFIDLRKYIFDSLVNFSDLTTLIWANNVYVREIEDIASKPKPFVSITSISWNVDIAWIRTWVYQIDIWAESVEQSEDIRDVIIDLFNRRNYLGIKSKLNFIWPDMSDEKTKLFRQIVEFDFVFKDQKM